MMAPMLHRVLEPEVMDSEQDAQEYAGIDNRAGNHEFAMRAHDLCPEALLVIDLGTGPAHIPIEFARLAPNARIVAVDLAEHMLHLARREISQAELTSRIELRSADVKATGLSASSFDLVLSNSVVHHLPEPVLLFREVVRLVAPTGGLLVRDLLRPASHGELTEIVERYAANDTPYQRRLFGESLHAALTLEEVEEACREAGLDDVTVERTSDRHFCAWRRGRKTTVG